MIPLVYPIGAGVLAIIGLRLRAVAKKKKDDAAKTAVASVSVPAGAPAQVAASVPARAVAPQVAAPTVIAAPVAAPIAALALDPVAVAALPNLVSNPDGSVRVEATPFVFSTNQDAASAVAEANQRGISVNQVLLERSGQVAAGASGGQQAVVTTNDPPPSGDLRVFATPNTSQQIGGIDKSGVVTILDSSDPTFALINWTGGRNPAVQGFANKKFLRNI